MPDAPDNELEGDLLDWHLGRLSPRQRAELRRRVSSDPLLARENEALGAIFGALESARPPAAPADLAERVLARVAALGPLPAARAAPAAEYPPQPGPAGPLARIHTLREVLAVAALIVLAVGLGVPSVLHVRERNQRIMCSRNLAQIGSGMQAYALQFGDSLPFVGWRPRRQSWQPTDAPGVTTVPNRRHVYPLLRGRYVGAIRFVCPAGGAMPMQAEQVRRRDDFVEARNLSYAYQNMAGLRPSLLDDPALPIMADDNPCFDDGRPLFEVARRLGLHDPAGSNSRIHRGAGQNVLTLDGRVIWTTAPTAGIAGDNIWTLKGVRRYTGQEGPQSKSDAHLLK